MAGSAAHISTVNNGADVEVAPDRLSLVRPASAPLAVAAGARNAQALAEQTGLLALNASIEAARSARSGHRFDLHEGRVVELAPAVEGVAATVVPLHRTVPAALDQIEVHHDGAGITPVSFKLRRTLP